MVLMMVYLMNTLDGILLGAQLGTGDEGLPLGPSLDPLLGITEGNNDGTVYGESDLSLVLLLVLYLDLIMN